MKGWKCFTCNLPATINLPLYGLGNLPDLHQTHATDIAEFASQCNSCRRCFADVMDKCGLCDGMIIKL